MIKKTLMAGLAIALLSPLPALASFYAGAGVGNSFVGHEVEDSASQIQSIDKNSTGFKFFGGAATESFLGFEGGFRSVGKVDGYVTDQSYSTKPSGWDAEALGRVRLSFVDLFAKAGAFFYKTTTFVDDTSDTNRGTGFLWGVGVGVNFEKVGLRLEYEMMNVDVPEDLSMVSLSLTLGF